MSTGLGDDERRLLTRADPRLPARQARGLDTDIPVRYVSIRTWCRITGLGKSTTYEMLADRRIRAIKVGNKTLIDFPHGMAHLDGLPELNLTTGLKRRAKRQAAAAARAPRKRGRPARSFGQFVSEATPVG